MSLSQHQKRYLLALVDAGANPFHVLEEVIVKPVEQLESGVIIGSERFIGSIFSILGQLPSVIQY
jgi:hypothetical protein